MNMAMNRNILTFLNEYAEISDPQYAIMLRGAWGCGKTFFIRQWIKQLKNDKDAYKLKWRPIYVSLYGLAGAKELAQEQTKIAVEAARYFGEEGKILEEISLALVNRRQ